jgi:hypothetical protein
MVIIFGEPKPGLSIPGNPFRVNLALARFEIVIQGKSQPGGDGSVGIAPSTRRNLGNPRKMGLFGHNLCSLISAQ